MDELDDINNEIHMFIDRYISDDDDKTAAMKDLQKLVANAYDLLLKRRARLGYDVAW